MSNETEVQEQTDTDFGFVVPTMSTIENEMVMVDPQSIEVSEEDSEVISFAQNVVSGVTSIDVNDLNQKQQWTKSFEQMNSDVEKDALRRSELLKRPIGEFSQLGGEDGSIQHDLLNLQQEVDELDPSKIDFSESGSIMKLLYKLGIPSPIAKYFAKYQRSDTVIESISQALRNGKDKIQRNNDILANDQHSMRLMTVKLEKAIRLGMEIDRQLSSAISSETDETKKKFLQEEILFTLRKRIEDLQQQMLVNQQGVMSTELLIRNGKMLNRAVTSALTVTIDALRIAVIVANALADQRMVLRTVQAVNKTTSNMLEQNSKMLLQDGLEIHKLATETSLDVDKLKNAFNNLHQLFDEISVMRQNALPEMAQAIIEMDEMADKSEKRISEMEAGNQMQSAMQIELLDAA